ncbi:MAG: T9SS type A sorting domain-containing protein [Flavipsychrobacter sp.]
MGCRSIVLFILSLLLWQTTFAQDVIIAPLNFNGALKQQPANTGAAHKTTAITLPFFEDFTDDITWTNKDRWVDDEVYINNTMGVNPISRGVATFDALNANGIPYNTSNPFAQGYADSLTSRDINLSTFTPADSVYMSFYYQPQGNGFYPETADSLMLFFKKKNQAWVKVWGKQGTTLDSFRQVMVPITDTIYLHDTFQFRFVNRASINTNDDVWNIDYIRIAANRTYTDTIINDVAFTAQPTNMLNDYTAITYKQFMADPNKERSSNISAFIRNNGTSTANTNYNLVASLRYTGTPLYNAGANGLIVNAGANATVTLPTYTNTVPLVNQRDNNFFENKYYIESVSPSDNKTNDTIVQHQEFYNYLAYDDGTAEKAYFLKLSATLPGKTAIEFHLNEPDTVTGVMIYFGRQVPEANMKLFSVAVYGDIAYNGGTDKVVYQEDYLYPQYLRNDFYYTYKFEKPVPMPAGTFYMTVIQPALSNSDSLYLGLDVNRTGANHLYYNVDGYWKTVVLSGAVMVRPVLGPIIPSGIGNEGGVIRKQPIFAVAPNPTKDIVTVTFNYDKPLNYELIDMQGKVLMRNIISSGGKIDIGNLASGMYMLRLTGEGYSTHPQKILKY